MCIAATTATTTQRHRTREKKRRQFSRFMQCACRSISGSVEQCGRLCFLSIGKIFSSLLFFSLFLSASSFNIKMHWQMLWNDMRCTFVVPLLSTKTKRLQWWFLICAYVHFALIRCHTKVAACVRVWVSDCVKIAAPAKWFCMHVEWIVELLAAFADVSMAFCLYGYVGQKCRILFTHSVVLCVGATMLWHGIAWH